MKKLRLFLLFYLILLCAPSAKTFASSMEKEGYWYPFIPETPNEKIQEIIEKVIKKGVMPGGSEEKIASEEDREKAAYAFRKLVISYAEKTPAAIEEDIDTFSFYYEKIKKSGENEESGEFDYEFSKYLRKCGKTNLPRKLYSTIFK
jgi:hypothetical protein